MLQALQLDYTEQIGNTWLATGQQCTNGYAEASNGRSTADQHHLLTANTLVTTPSAVGPCVVLKMSHGTNSVAWTYTDGRSRLLGLSTAAGITQEGLSP